jgi:hypothetical protein
LLGRLHPFSFLGILVGVNLRRYVIWQPIMEYLRKMLVTFNNLMASNLFLYLFFLQGSYLHLKRNFQRNFLWGGCLENKESFWVGCVTSQTTFLKIVDTHKPTQIFSVCYVLTRTLFENFAKDHSSKECSKSNILNCKVLLKCATKNMYLIAIGSANQLA